MALSLVISLTASLVVGAFTMGSEREQSAQVRADVATLKEGLRTALEQQQKQALELATLKTELRAIRESQARMEAILDRAFSPPLRPPVRALPRTSSYTP